MASHDDDCMRNRGEESGNQQQAIWATRAQIAKRYEVHPGTIDTWRRSGFLPSVALGTRLVRFDIRACDAWFNQFRQSAKWEQERTKLP
jgi:hypothetical protein